MSTSGESGSVPQEVSDLVASLLGAFRVVKGPSGVAMIGKRTDKGTEWWDAREMEASVFGDIHLKIAGPHKKATISRLRRLAPEEAQVAAFHAQSNNGVVSRRPGKFTYWHYTPNDGAPIELGGPQSTVNLLVAGIRTPQGRVLTRLSAWPGIGRYVKVHGSLVDGDLAYANVADSPLRIVVPCGNGAARNVVVVLERERGFDVLGFRLERPVDAGSEPDFKPIGSDFTPSYYPLWLDPEAKTRLRVLKLPAD